MEQIGEVIEINGRNATVRIRRVSSCSERCASCSAHCRPTATVITAVNGLSAKVGDTVKLQMNSGLFLMLAFVGYILPILICLATYAVVKYITDSTIAADICAVVSVAVTLVVFYIIDKLPHRRGIFSSRIIKIIR